MARFEPRGAVGRRAAGAGGSRLAYQHERPSPAGRVESSDTRTASGARAAEDQLAFRDQAELVLYRALKAKQASLPKTETLTILPNSGVRVPTRTWEPDFVVVYKGRAGIIEVDGSSHTKKYASDRSRDYKLEEAGFHTIRRIDVADAENPDEAEAFIESFLARLGK